EVRVSTDNLTAPAGLVRAVGVTAIAHSANGVAQPDVELTLSVLQGIGRIGPQTAITDEKGQISASYLTIVPSGQSTVKLRAATAQVVGENQFIINGVHPPSSIEMIPETSELTVSCNTNGIIRLETILTDSLGVGVPGVRLRYQISEFSDDSPVFGSISGGNITDEYGHAEAVFRSDLGSGTVYVTAFVDEVGFEEMFKTVPLTVRILAEEPESISILVTPNIQRPIHPDSLTATNISIQARDRNNIGIPNLRFKMNADIGMLSGSFLTDSSGILNVQHLVRPSEDVEHNGDFTVTICVELTDFGWSDIIELPFDIKRIGFGSLTLSSDRSYMYADGPGGSVAHFTAVVQDADGQLFFDEEIIYTTSSENWIISPDSLGSGATLDDNGNLSEDELESVTVTATCPPRYLEVSALIRVRERNTVSRIDLHSNARQLQAGLGDSTELRATVYMADGSPAPSGTVVYFRASSGRFSEELVPVSGNAGTAHSMYFPRNIVQTDTIVAFVVTEQDTIFSNYQIIEFIAGPPGQILIEGVPNEIPVGSPVGFRLVATILDVAGNPVRQGTFVTVRSTLIPHPPSFVTDIDGQVIMNLSVSSAEPGFGTITVIAGEVEETFRIEFV
ncbi:MAG: hypothetical protein HN356_16065, partial [Calditrichaeota bacterium]|nr:hypothetical protein [Calditrichota bacterium]